MCSLFIHKSSRIPGIFFRVFLHAYLIQIHKYSVCPYRGDIILGLFDLSLEVTIASGFHSDPIKPVKFSPRSLLKHTSSLLKLWCVRNQIQRAVLADAPGALNQGLTVARPDLGSPAPSASS